MPSTGCALCRQRRVKCDEGKPGCNRCSKIGKPCPGYDRGLRLVFYGGAGKSRRDTPPTFTTEEQPAVTDSVGQPVPVRRARKQNQRCQQHQVSTATTLPPPPSSESPFSSSSEPLPDEHSIDAQIVPIRPTLTADIDIRAICLFNSSFVVDSRSQSGDPYFLDFLPELYLNSSPDSCLHHTLTALAHLNFLNRYKASDTLLDWVKHSYGRGLRATNHALSCPSLAATNETLTAVWILSMYELLDPTVMTPTGQRTAWTNHVSGTLALLRMRGKEQLLTRTGRHLFLLMSTPIIAMNMMLGEKPLKRLAELNRLMVEIDPDESSGPGLAHAFIHRVATVRSELRAWIESHQTSVPSGDDLADLQTIIHRGPSVVDDQTDYERWTLDKPAWRPKKVSPAVVVGGTPSAPSEYTRYAFTSTHILSQWLIIWTTKLLHRQTLLDSLFLHAKIARHLHPSDSASPAAAATPDLHALKDQLVANADRLIGAVSFAFGDIDPAGAPTSALVSTGSSAHSSSAVGAYHMFWPMGAVVASPYTSPRQKRLAREALRSVGERFCVAQALKYVIGGA